MLVLLTLSGMRKIGQENLAGVVLAASVSMQLGMGIEEVKLGEGLGSEDLVELVATCPSRTRQHQCQILLGMG